MKKKISEKIIPGAPAASSYLHGSYLMEQLVHICPPEEWSLYFTGDFASLLTCSKTQFLLLSLVVEFIAPISPPTLPYDATSVGGFWIQLLPLYVFLVDAIIQLNNQFG